MWLIQRVVHQGVVSLTQQLMHIVIVFVIFVVVVVVGGGGVWNRLCVLRLVVYSLVLLSTQLSVGFVVHSTVPSMHHCQKWYLLQYGHRPYTVMSRSLGTSVISCTARAVLMLL